MLTINDLPNVKVTSTGGFRQSQPLTKANVLKVLEHLGVVVKFNVMLSSPSYVIQGVEVSQDDVGTVIEAVSDVLVKLDVNGLGRLEPLLADIARQEKFHPMEDWLRGLEWDGVDRFDALVESIKTDEPLWPVYLENWLVQTVEGVCGWHGKAKASLPHVLVLVGGQGTGKSYWLKQLGGAWFKGEAELHLSSASGKDHQIAALQHPMVELAELDGIFRKADVSHMKAFISRDVDEIRLPYGRRAIVRPRMTSFCGSVNDAEFLNDPSGSRRFWPVMVDSIDWTFSMDWSQLWAQAFAFWEESPAFNLTDSENATRAQRAVETHAIESDESEVTREYLRLHVRNKQFPLVAMSTLDVLHMLFGKNRNFSNKQKADAGRVLSDMLGNKRTLNGKQRAWLVPFNNLATDRACWPDKISLI